MDWIIGILGPHKMFFCFFIIYWLLEKLRPVVRGQKLFREEIGQDLLWYTLNSTLDVGLAYLRNYITLIVVYKFWVHLWPFNFKNSLFMGAGLFLGVDFFGYWIHFSFHKFKPLWRMHMLHHSPEKLDGLSGARVYWLDGFIYSFIPAFLMALLKVDEDIIGWYVLFDTNLQFFIHTNFRYSLGKLGVWLNNNHAHWWHHSKESPYKYGHNFGSFTLIWDHLFGTYYAEEGYPVEIGLRDSAAYSKDFFVRLYSPFLKG